MREDSWVRGALLSALIFGGVTLFATAVPATAQGTPDNMECEGMDCSDSTTVTGENPNDHNYTVPIYVPPYTPPPPPTPIPSNYPPPSGDQGLTAEDWDAIDALMGDLCEAIRNGEDAGTIIAAILAIAKKSPVLFVIIKGGLEAAEAGCSLIGK